MDRLAPCVLAALLSCLAPRPATADTPPAGAAAPPPTVLLNGRAIDDGNDEVGLGDRIDIVFDAPGRPRIVGCPEGKGPLTFVVDGVPAMGVESVTPPDSSRAAFVVRRTDESADLWLGLFKRSRQHRDVVSVSLGLACKRGGPYAVTDTASTASALGAAVCAAAGTAEKAASAAAAAASAAPASASEVRAAVAAAAGAARAAAALAAAVPASAASATTLHQSPSTIGLPVKLRMVARWGYGLWGLAMLVLGAVTLGAVGRGLLRDSPPSPAVLDQIAQAEADSALKQTAARAMAAGLGAPVPAALLLPAVGKAPPATMPFSLSKTQLLLWTLAVVAVASHAGIVTGQLPALSAQVLGFLGVSAGTSILARAIEAQRSKMPTQAQGFLADLVNDESNRPSVARFQALVVTLALLAYFLWQGFVNLLLPPLDATWVVLMGISSATYLSFKQPDVKQ